MLRRQHARCQTQSPSHLEHKESRHAPHQPHRHHGKLRQQQSCCRARRRLHLDHKDGHHAPHRHRPRKGMLRRQRTRCRTQRNLHLDEEGHEDHHRALERACSAKRVFAKHALLLAEENGEPHGEALKPLPRGSYPIYTASAGQGRARESRERTQGGAVTEQLQQPPVPIQRKGLRRNRRATTEGQPDGIVAARANAMPWLRSHNDPESGSAHRSCCRRRR
jgi:hypothetical protein